MLFTKDISRTDIGMIEIGIMSYDKVSMLHKPQRSFLFSSKVSNVNLTDYSNLKHVLKCRVSWPNDSRFKRYTQKRTLPWKLILIKTSQFLKLMKWFKILKLEYLMNEIWLFHEIRILANCASKSTFSELIIF